MKSKSLRTVCVALAFTVAGAFSGSALAAAGVVTASKLTTRTAPVISSTTKSGSLAKGASVEITDTIEDGETYNGKKVSGDWYKLSNGKFVSADFVELTEEDAPLDDEDEEEAPLDDEEEAPLDDEDDVIDVEPGTDGDVVDVDITDDDSITVDEEDILDVDDEEIPVDDEEVPADEDEELPPDEDELPTEDEGFAVTITASKLTVRQKPSTSAAKLGTLAKGKVVSASATLDEGTSFGGSKVAGDWYEIDFGGQTGYISAAYAKVGGTLATAQTVTLTITATKSVYKTNQKTTVYKLPTTLANAAKTLASGTTVSVAGTVKNGASFTGLASKVSGTWYKLGSSQYVQSKCLTVSKTTGKTSVEVELGTTLVLTSTVNQRAKPATSATSLGKLASGSNITIVGAYLDGSTYGGAKVSGNWIQVKGGGFVSADYVKLP